MTEKEFYLHVVATMIRQYPNADITDLQKEALVILNTTINVYEGGPSEQHHDLDDDDQSDFGFDHG